MITLRYLILRVESKGCGSCIATAIVHLLKIDGVKGAYTRGRDLIVVLEDDANPERIIHDPSLRTYYKIISWHITSTIEKPVYSYWIKS